MRMLDAAVCLSKFFKDVFVLISRDALAVVSDRDPHIRRVALNIYADRSICFCEFHRVADQVFENAADHISIANRQDRVGWHVAVKRSVF